MQSEPMRAVGWRGGDRRGLALRGKWLQATEELCDEADQ
jgi:hypothetical protein